MRGLNAILMISLPTKLNLAGFDQGAAMSEWRLSDPVILLSPALILCLAQAMAPLAEFVHRGDDAFYYFQVARNHALYGFWTFDGIHPTNGFQPLWAIVLTATAHVAARMGIDDPLTLARLFVALNGAIYFAGCVLLYRLLARRVSTGVALAAAGAVLFPLGAAWGRMWGMETGLYVFTLMSSMIYFHRAFLPGPSLRSAIVLGVLLGACAMGRLNGVFFIACMLSFYILRRSPMPRFERMQWAVVAGLAASAVVLTYVGWNYFSTGHALPISGAVKAVRTDELLARAGVVDLWSALVMLRDQWTDSLKWLVASRIVDGFWIAAVRSAVDGDIGMKAALALVALTAALPLLAGPAAWLRRLRACFGRLRAYTYFGAFAAIDVAVSILLYPSERYAATRWWFVAAEITITVLVAALVVSALEHGAARWLKPRNRLRALYAAVVLLSVVHTVQFTAFYWDGRVRHRDWNLSWNDESLMAARWANANLPDGAVIGSWNAGVLGYFAERPVVNLDGLINNFDLLPYLRERRIGDYVRREGITHLADLEPMFESTGVRSQLGLTEIYRHRSEFMHADYVIYVVD